MTQEKQEPTKRSNPDYTATAVKLINPPEVKGLLDEYLAALKLADEADDVLMKEIEALPSAKTEKEARELAKEARTNLEVVIAEFGGYQDREQGLYALQQVRKQVSYNPELIKEHIPTYADKILCQVDGNVLKGLVRGKLVTQEQVDLCAVTKKSTRFVIEAMS